MKQYTNNSEEQLYQQIMSSLDADAAEYDRMIASGEAPAQKAAVVRMRRMWIWSAAACIAVVIACGAYFMTGGMRDEEQAVAKTDIVDKVNVIPADTTTAIVNTVAIEPEHTADELIAEVKVRVVDTRRDVKEKQQEPSVSSDFAITLPEVNTEPEPEPDITPEVEVVSQPSYETAYIIQLPDYDTYDSSFQGAGTVGIRTLVYYDE